MAPIRRTRRRIAYWLMGIITAVVGWMFLPGDIEPLEQALAITIVPAMIAGVIAFISGETYSDHSERKNKEKEEDA